MNAFGVVVPGRMVRTTPDVVVSQNNVVFDLPCAETIKSVAVFLTGVVALPEGTAAAVYFAWPPYTSYRFLGYVSAAKPSAVFRLNSDTTARAVASCATRVTARLGLAVETMEQVEATVVALQKNSGVSLSTQGLVFEADRDLPAKMVGNFYDFCISFATATPQAVPGVQWFPASAADAWAKSARARLRENPNLFSA